MRENRFRPSPKCLPHSRTGTKPPKESCKTCKTVLTLGVRLAQIEATFSGLPEAVVETQPPEPAAQLRCT
jgi:hypothetical protein